MPSVNLQIIDLGPVIDVSIGVSAPRRKALEAAGQNVPNPVRSRLLIDTGASSTCLDDGVINSLGLTPSGQIPMHTPSTTANNPHYCNQFDVSLIIPHQMLSRQFNAVPVVESKFVHQGIDGLLGRDILNECLFIYNGELGIYTLSF